MSFLKNDFDDAELTLLALEIMKDLPSMPQNTTNDPFICELAEEIEQELLSELAFDISVMSGSSYTDPSIYLESVPSTIHKFNNAFHQSHTLAPSIVSRGQMSSNDSFNQSLPSIPSVSVSLSRSKSRTNRYKYKKRLPKPTKPKKPMKSSSSPTNAFATSTSIPPPISLTGLSFPNDISQCLSPRAQTPEPKRCQIPLFCEFDDVVALRVPKNQKCYKNTKKKTKKKRQNLLVPIFTSIHQNTVNKRKTPTSVTPTAPSNNCNRQQRRGVKGRKIRSNSQVVTGDEMEQYKGYATQGNAGFMYIHTSNGVLKVPQRSNRINCLMSRGRSVN